MPGHRLHRTQPAAATWLVLGLWACAAEDGETSTTSWTGIVIEDGSTGEDSSSSPRESDESTTTEDGGASMPATTSGAPADETGESTGGADPVGGICSPIGSDAPCTACTKANCCAQLEACSSDPSCGCYMTCVATTADVFGCGTECGVDLFAPGPVGDLVACSSGPCVAACT